MTWQFWIDVGGTFTDCLARDPAGQLHRRKVLSSAVVKGTAAWNPAARRLIDPARREPAAFWSGYTLRLLDARGQIVATSRIQTFEPPTGFSLEPLIIAELPESAPYELVSPEEAPILAIRLFLGLRLDQPLPPCEVRLGTTRGTNALLTRRGARVGFVTTRGLADILAIGYQNRPRLFDLAIRKPPPLYHAVAQIDERIAADGSVLQPPSEHQIYAALAPLREQAVDSLAICLLNSYANPAHEQLVARIASQLGFSEISLSHQVSPLMRIVPRGDTTVVDAYLNPVLRQYVGRLRQSLAASDLRLMTSAGGLASPASFSGKDSILSGPAGGVIGFSRASQATGFDKAIGFDMGGTSTDVARFDGRYEYEHETEKAGVRIVAPMLAIETVAAGGGSICSFDGVKFVVGPDSAGADPGPACYGRGGPLTVTDCNLMLGRVVAERFPFALDPQAARARLAEVILCSSSQPATLTPEQAAAGFLRIANANMAQAIRSISLARGYDLRDYVLVAFGSAAPQHACAVAQELSITKVLVHPDAGVQSALGIGLADIIKHRAAAVYERLDDCERRLPSLFAQLSAQAAADVEAEGPAPDQIEVHRSLELRYLGADAALTIPEPADGDFAAAFLAQHQQRYGYIHSGRSIEVVAARVQATGQTNSRLPPSHHLPPATVHPTASQRLYVQDRFQNVPLFARGDLMPGAQITGPAVIVEPLTSTIVEPNWQLNVLSGNELLLTHQPPSVAPNPQSAIRNPQSADPILLELYSNHFTAIATQMGITLRNTSLSVNVKERLDFSCAIFTAAGDLVVNAPHIPVHLGAMGETVKSILADNPQLQPGDVFVTNDPYHGGSHLPDVTVVTPVFSTWPPGPGWLGADAVQPRPTMRSSPELIFFTASRAHHAEIGGLTPGSMPPFSKNLAEEGVVIRNFKLVAAGQERLAALRELLASGPYPSRSIDANLADITAQLAANHQGAHDLARLVAEHSWPVVRAYMEHIQSAAETKLRQALARLAPGVRTFTDHLDDGTPLCVTVTVEHDRATLDFTGAGPVSPGNLNANRSIVTAAVLYVLRLLIGEDVPLNQGLLAPIEIVLPPSLLNPPAGSSPADSPAVVGGNVETSQRLVDVLLGAFGLAAASQGTMNNLLFGNATFGYYETICGGSGACPAAPGADAVHTHMTNTRITDPEVLEARYPVRLREFSIRRRSGGKGLHRGGDGVTRSLEFLQRLTLSILSQRRGPYPPYGLAGGQPGALGRNQLLQKDGTLIELPALTQREVEPGDTLIIETPGGGAWGPAP